MPKQNASPPRINATGNPEKKQDRQRYKHGDRQIVLYGVEQVFLLVWGHTEDPGVDNANYH